MPGMDGYETCRRLKADPATADAAVIFLSALEDAREKVRGLEAGAVDFVTKPFQPEEVLARVHTHLTVQRLQRQLAGRNAELQRELAVAQELLTDARRRVEGPFLGTARPRARCASRSRATRRPSTPSCSRGRTAWGRRLWRARSTTPPPARVSRSSTSTAPSSRPARPRAQSRPRARWIRRGRNSPARSRGARHPLSRGDTPDAGCAPAEPRRRPRGGDPAARARRAGVPRRARPGEHLGASFF